MATKKASSRGKKTSTSKKKVEKTKSKPSAKKTEKKPAKAKRTSAAAAKNKATVSSLTRKKDDKPVKVVRNKQADETERFSPTAAVAKTNMRSAESAMTRLSDLLEEHEEIKIITPKSESGELTVEDKLLTLYQLQRIDSKVDRIRILRGELPMEISDLEDEIAGLQTRVNNYNEELKAIETNIANKKQSVKDAHSTIKKYDQQASNVKNNREYESLMKEKEFQQLEIQLSEKKAKEAHAELAAKQTILQASEKALEERQVEMKKKKSELDTIVAETQKEEEHLLDNSKKAARLIEERLLQAYHRIRHNAQNGLAVVTVQRDACGGCFNKIPPQRQLDIRQRKKIIVCEHCGRILVDPNILDRN